MRWRPASRSTARPAKGTEPKFNGQKIELLEETWSEWRKNTSIIIAATLRHVRVSGGGRRELRIPGRTAPRGPCAGRAAPPVPTHSWLPGASGAAGAVSCVGGCLRPRSQIKGSRWSPGPRKKRELNIDFLRGNLKRTAGGTPQTSLPRPGPSRRGDGRFRQGRKRTRGSQCSAKENAGRVPRCIGMLHADLSGTAIKSLRRSQTWRRPRAERRRPARCRPPPPPSRPSGWRACP